MVSCIVAESIRDRCRSRFIACDVVTESPTCRFDLFDKSNIAVDCVFVAVNGNCRAALAISRFVDSVSLGALNRHIFGNCDFVNLREVGIIIFDNVLSRRKRVNFVSVFEDVTIVGV